VEKYRRARKATDDSMAHAHCMLDSRCYEQTVYCFSTTTVVAGTRLNVTYSIYVHCLSCLLAASSARCDQPKLRAVFPGKAVEDLFSAEVANTRSFIATFPCTFMVYLNTRMSVPFS